MTPGAMQGRAIGSSGTAIEDGVVKEVVVSRGIIAAALAKVVANARDKTL